MDGHSSHYCPQTIRFAAEKDVILFTLPPNTTHITQPLDKGCFGPFKSAWKESVHKYMIDNPGKVVTRYTFSPLFCEAWMKSMTVKNILSAFKIAGIQPFDRNAVRIPHKPQSPLASTSGIKYIPFLTPSKRSQPHPSRDISTLISPSSAESSDEVVQMPEFESPGAKNFKPAVRTKALHLKIPPPLYKEKGHQPKKCSRVLTSKENLEAMEEKKKKKEEEIKKKAEMKKLREEKQKERQANKLKKIAKPIDFTAEEIQLFQRRFDNGYDIKTDHRYNQWLKVHDAPSDRASSKLLALS